MFSVRVCLCYLGKCCHSLRKFSLHLWQRLSLPHGLSQPLLCHLQHLLQLAHLLLALTHTCTHKTHAKTEERHRCDHMSNVIGAVQPASIKDTPHGHKLWWCSWYSPLAGWTQIHPELHMNLGDAHLAALTIIFFNTLHTKMHKYENASPIINFCCHFTHCNTPKEAWLQQNNDTAHL